MLEWGCESKVGREVHGKPLPLHPVVGLGPLNQPSEELLERARWWLPEAGGRHQSKGTNITQNNSNTTTTTNKEGGRKRLEGMDVFMTSIIGMVSQLYTYSYTHQVVDTKYVQIFIC